MAEPAPKLTVVSKNPSVMVQREMSPQEAEMYAMLRQYRCHRGDGSACPAHIVVGQAGVVLECPTCGWVGQTYPEAESD
jgi:predicted RNA-binding Zn-ribbon protein involved in translation (DUF1610 family)